MAAIQSLAVGAMPAARPFTEQMHTLLTPEQRQTIRNRQWLRDVVARRERRRRAPVCRVGGDAVPASLAAAWEPAAAAAAPQSPTAKSQPTPDSHA